MDLKDARHALGRNKQMLRVGKDRFDFTGRLIGGEKTKRRIVDLSFLAEEGSAMEENRQYLGLMFADRQRDIWMYVHVLDQGVVKPALLKVWTRRGFPQDWPMTWLASVKDRYGDHPYIGMRDLGTIERMRDREPVYPSSGQLWVLSRQVNRLAPGEILKFGPSDHPEKQDRLQIEHAIVNGTTTRVGVLSHIKPHFLPDPSRYCLPSDFSGRFLRVGDPVWENSLYVYRGEDLLFDCSAAGQLIYMELWYGADYFGLNLFMAVPMIEEGEKICRPVLIDSSPKMYSQLFGSVSSSTYRYLLSYLNEAK